MTETVTITHHTAIQKYSWEIVIPEAPTILLPAEHIDRALALLGVGADEATKTDILNLPNGGSRSVNADLTKQQTEELESLGI